MITLFKRGKDLQLTNNFHLREIECKCGLCPYTLVSIPHIEKLQRVRDAVKKEIIITSGYRCPQHNFNVGGKPFSLHTTGLATDVFLPFSKMSNYVSYFDVFDGLGIYTTFLHVDSRGYEIARW